MGMLAQNATSNSNSDASKEKVYTVDLEARNKLIPLFNEVKNLMAKNDFEKAIPVLLKINKSDSLISSVYSDLFKAALMSKNSSDEVLSCLHKGKRIYVEDPTMTYYIAEVFRMRQNYSQAISQYSEAINQSVGTTEKSFFYPDFFKNRAYCYSKQQKYNAALTDYTECLKLKSSDANLYINRGICYLNSGNKKKALEDFNASLGLGNKNAQSYIDKLSK